MRRLGLSIYPDKSSVEDMKNYLDRAKKAGFSRIFSNLISADEGKDKIKERFLDINTYAKELGFEIIVDVNPRFFEDLGISYKDLSFFKEIKADGIRLDQGFTGQEEAMMTFNPEGLKIEINMSMDTHTIDTIMDYQPNRYNLIGCHNFYPHVYTGLPLDFFIKTSKRFQGHNLRTAAFVTSQNENTFGPWPVSQGLPSLEMHRNLALDVQVKHLISLDLIDDILISNCYPSDSELEKLADLPLDKVVFDVELIDEIPDLMKEIILENPHFYRGDASEYVIRSSMSRVKYKGRDFPIINAPKEIKRGDIIIESSEYGHYAGELQIAKKDMINTGLSNVVGRVCQDEIFILDSLRPWQKFGFRLKK